MQRLAYEAIDSLDNLAYATRNDIADHSSSSPDVRDTEDLHDRLRQWVANTGARVPGTSEMSLEFRLEKAFAVKDAISGFLVDLTASANLAMQIIQGKRPNRVAKTNIESLDPRDYGLSPRDPESSRNHQDPEDNNVNELQQLIKTIKTSLDSLFEASALISGLSNRTHCQRTRDTEPLPTQIDEALIRNAFPYLGKRGTLEAQTLILRLAEANVRRRQYFLTRRETHERLPPSQDAELSSVKNSESGIQQAELATKSGLRSPPSEEEALHLYHPSGPGRSRATSVAPESDSDTSGGRALLDDDREAFSTPNMPDEAAISDSFTCNYCFAPVQFQYGNKERQWYVHLIEDLKPYVCTFPTCESEPFATHAAWFQHELLRHRRSWICYLCSAQSSSQDDLEHHFSNVHESIPSSQVQLLVAGADQSTGELDTSLCPFCDADWAPSTSGAGGKQPRRTVVSIDTFQRHVGQHLREIALFSLPKPEADDRGRLQMPVRCFFRVLDPEGTGKLRGTKHSACLLEFKDVNRLREHLWRAHSPTHNCRYCRKKTTKPTEEFRREHAACTPSSKAINARPRPVLLTWSQVDALKALNQHFNRPNNEYTRYKKLVTALFPGHAVDMSLVMTPVTSQTGYEVKASHYNTESGRNQSTRQTSKAKSTHHATKPPLEKSLFYQLKSIGKDGSPFPPLPTERPGPSAFKFATLPKHLSAASRDSGIGTEPSHPDNQHDFSSRTIPHSENTLRDGTELAGISSRGPLQSGLPVLDRYPSRIVEVSEDEDAGVGWPDDSSSEAADTSGAYNDPTSSS